MLGENLRRKKMLQEVIKMRKKVIDRFSVMYVG